MFGLIEQTEKAAQSRKSVEQLSLCGTQFANVEIVITARTPKWLIVHRCETAAKRLRRANITQAVFPAGFQWTEQFQKRGVLPVATLPLYRALIPELVRQAMVDHELQPTAARIAIIGDRLTKDLTYSITALCLHNRYVQLEVPAGGEILAQSLRRSLGVPLVTAVSRGQLERADVLVLLTEQPQLSLTNPVVLRLYDELHLPPLPHLDLPPLEFPEGCHRVQFLTALWQSGIVKLPNFV